MSRKALNLKLLFTANGKHERSYYYWSLLRRGWTFGLLKPPLKAETAIILVTQS